VFTAALLLAAVASACTSLRVGVGGSDVDDRRVVPSQGPTGSALGVPPPTRGQTGAAPSGDVAGPSQASDASAPAPAAFTPRIGYISLDEDIAFVRAVSAGVREAVERAGLELVECDPDWTREGVVRCAERLGGIGVDGLLSFQPFADLASQVCDLTGSVPTAGLVFDQGPCQVTGLDIDQAEAGRLAGDAVGRVVRQRWDCELSAYVSLESSADDPDGKARMAGYRTGFLEHCPLPTRHPVLDGADRLITAQTAMALLLPDLRGRRIVVVGINADAILGAMAAAAELGRADDLWYSGQLADAGIRGHIACDRRYLASVAQFPERFGDQIVPLLAEAMAGQPVPSTVEAQLELVTAKNVRDLFPDTPSCAD
jgi:ribose transport system substrate-binding protein